MNLRDFAKGQPCTVMFPGCERKEHDETTVLGHLRTPATGMSMKEYDLLGAHVCNHCHDYLDGRQRFKPDMETEAFELYFFEGMVRTVKRVYLAIEEGYLDPEDVFPNHAIR
jgi:hypothetical protein